MDFLCWSFGDIERASSLEARSDRFRLWLKPVIERRQYQFREEVFRACERLDQRRNGRPIALCYSAGFDSEIIAHALATLGIPFELYFLDIWGLNRDAFHFWSKDFLQKSGKAVEVVSLTKEHFYREHLPKAFEDMGCEYPTYLGLSYLFSRIPSDRFIVVGDGDLDRSGPLYQVIGSENPAPEGNDAYIPFSSARVAYEIWARRNQREGEFYFFSSTPELVASILESPQFSIRYPEVADIRHIVQQSFPELRERPKSTNWDGEAYKENVWVRSRVRRIARNNGITSFWRPGIGAAVRMDDIFL